MPDSLSDHIDSNLHLLTLSASLTLRYWLNRIKRAGELTAEQAGQDYQSWDLVDQHRAYLLGLLDSTAALYSWVWPLVLELIQVMDPVMRARGYFAEWLPVLQTLANHMTNALEAEDFGDPDAVAKLWRCVALSYIGLG
ncbi:MAG: hypothetical protein JW910_21680, partial [Anaerolineae bacterium]|nr:hypothetical protein [Anaerolineae bacterium]